MDPACAGVAFSPMVSDSFLCLFPMFSVFSGYFLYVLKHIGLFGLIIAREDDFKLSMPSYRLFITCDDYPKSSVPSNYLLRRLPILSAHVLFLDLSCVL